MMQGSKAVSAATPLEARHQPSGLNSRFNGDGLTFAEYAARSRDMISQARAATRPADMGKAVAGNMPFELWPNAGQAPGVGKIYRRGVLLTHGLTDSPYFMRYLGEFFQQHGFRVLAILLPGHGTQPGDLLDVSWQQWHKAVAFGCDRLASEVDEIYLAGFSAGGALSLYHSLHDNRVHGLFLFSPALEISSRAAWAKLHKLYSWLIPSAKWVGIMPDTDIYKYESFPKNAAAQMHALTRGLAAQLQQHEVSIPVFAAASVDDVTTNTAATVSFMVRSRHACNRLVLYATDSGKLPADIPANKLEWVNSMLPEQKILSSAHTAIVLPPDDAYYGAAGSYSNCIHYYPEEMDKYDACNSRNAEIFQGEITEENLKAGTLRRLMYNPNFAALKVSMQQFIDSLPS